MVFNRFMTSNYIKRTSSTFVFEEEKMRLDLEKLGRLQLKSSDKQQREKLSIWAEFAVFS